MYNITVIYFISKVIGQFHGVGGGKSKVKSCRPDGYSGDSVTPTFMLNFKVFRPNRFTQVPIENDFHLFYAASFISDEVII